MDKNARWRRKIVQLGWDLALGCAIAAMVAGVWFGFLAWKLASPMFAMLAVVLVLAAPALAVALVVARPDRPGEESEPPESIVVDSIQRADAALRIVRLGRAHVGVVSSYVLLLWICEVGGMISAGRFLIFFTFACTVTAAAFLPWLARRELQLHEDRADFQRVRGELEAGTR